MDAMKEAFKRKINSMKSMKEDSPEEEATESKAEEKKEKEEGTDLAPSLKNDGDAISAIADGGSSKHSKGGLHARAADAAKAKMASMAMHKKGLK